MPESRFYHITPAGTLVPVPTVADALAAVRGGGFLWLDYCQPAKEDLSALVEPLGFNPLSVEDCTDDNQIPKVEDYPTNTFILFNAFVDAHRTLSIHEVDLVLGGNFLVTVSGRDPDGQRVLDGIERLVELDTEGARQGPAFLLHVILDQIVDRKFAAIEALEEKLDRAEEAILADPPRFNPATLLHLRRDLLAIRKSLFHEREILVKICRKDCPFIPEKALYPFRDIYDHLAKFFELTETSRDIVSSLMEMYLSMLNNRMARVANDTNVTIRRLTFITTIFMPLTLLAGVGGMSEWSMMTGSSNWPVAYPAFLLAMGVIGAGTYYVLRWIERQGREPKRPA
jgi:magnesium transporter